MNAPLVVWLCVQVASLTTYGGLVVHGHGWWAVPVLAIAALRKRPTAVRA